MTFTPIVLPPRQIFTVAPSAPGTSFGGQARARFEAGQIALAQKLAEIRARFAAAQQTALSGRHQVFAQASPDQQVDLSRHAVAPVTDTAAPAPTTTTSPFLGTHQTTTLSGDGSRHMAEGGLVKGVQHYASKVRG